MYNFSTILYFSCESINKVFKNNEQENNFIFKQPFTCQH